jgi:CTP synthase
VTGGVVSSLGKGLTSASIAMLLERRGLTVRMQKLDPYLNVDPGTMSPYQHGEVYVLNDGAECDLDLGHYERFTNAPLDKHCNYTTGRIYQAILKKERAGAYKGKTVQVIPHVTDEIKACIRRMVAPDVDVVITEIGGTVGDIEGMPFFEAIRQFAFEAKHDCLFIHLTLVPYLKAAGELKTKPTQHSVQELRKIGIQPDILICRTERDIPRDECDKIALFCNVEPRAVIPEKDRDHSIYEVPISLHSKGLDDLIVEKLQLRATTQPVLDDWEAMLEKVIKPAGELAIAFVGKYVKHRDSYKSVYEALDHAGVFHHVKVKVTRIEAERFESEPADRLLASVDGVLVPGGFDKRGTNGKIEAIRFARETNLPFFGICLGLQCATIEYARNMLGLEGANSTEFDAKTPDPVVDLMETQIAVTQLGGSMRLGAYKCIVKHGTKAMAAYGAPVVSERHRHRYEVNNAYRQRLEEAGLVISGTTEDGALVEMIELRDHPWYVAVQCHPEFQSKPTRPQPLFRDFIGAAKAHKAMRSEWALATA